MDEIDEVVNAVAAANLDPGLGFLVVTSRSANHVAPDHPSGVMRYMGVQTSTEDYFPASNSVSRLAEHRRAVEVLSSNNSRETMLQALAELASTIAQPALVPDLIQGFREFLGRLGAPYLSNFDLRCSNMTAADRSSIGNSSLQPSELCCLSPIRRTHIRSCPRIWQW